MNIRLPRGFPGGRRDRSGPAPACNEEVEPRLARSYNRAVVDPKDEVASIAALARLDLEPSERDRIAAQFGEILRHFESIRSLHTKWVPPLVHATGTADVTRPDVPRPSLPREELLSNAPEPSSGFFAVPKVIEG